MKSEADVKAGVADSPLNLGDWSGRRAGRAAEAILPQRIKATRSEKPGVTIRITNNYHASPKHAFEVWLDPAVAGKWLFATASKPMAHVEIDRRVGGSFCFVERQGRATIEFTGQYIEIVPTRRLVFTLSMEPYPDVLTRVAVAIGPLARGCALTLTHENIPRAHASYMKGRWTGILYGLGVTLDSISAMFHHDQE